MPQWVEDRGYHILDAGFLFAEVWVDKDPYTAGKIYANINMGRYRTRLNEHIEEVDTTSNTLEEVKVKCETIMGKICAETVAMANTYNNRIMS